MKLLLITPPFIQTNSPYPATAYLSSYLKNKNIQVQQIDLSIKLHLSLFSAKGLKLIREEILRVKRKKQSESVLFFLEAFDDYVTTVEPIIRFLQGKDHSTANRIVARALLPEGPRFLHFRQHEEQILSSFGTLGTIDLAQYMASLYMDDLYDVIKSGIDEDFGFSHYAESLSSSQISYEPILAKLKSPESLIDRILLQLFENELEKHQPDLIGFTIPFAGNFYSALKMANHLKKKKSKIKTIMGGGYINTELRDIQDSRFFESVDFLIYDDGEKPLELLIHYLQNKIPKEELLRTKFLFDKKIIFCSDQKNHDVAFKGLSAPLFTGLPLDDYFAMVEVPNQMRRMWTGYRWNKMILAHGCYWKKCSFCDVTLDYIGRFESQKAESIVDQIEEVIRQTGTTGFHFVDEAAPPALLRQMSKELIKRGLKITWWSNLRFDSQFDEELVTLMKDAGCVAVTGGLEVASPRLLSLINKGLTIEQVAKVTRRFKLAGIFVHAYLMYGFPSQTAQETIESLEIVRQLFENACLDSGFWHRFVATVHSPIGKNPEKFGIKLQPFKIPAHGKFSEYSIPFQDLAQEAKKTNHDKLSQGLNKALYNYMHGIGIREKVEVWFDSLVPKSKISRQYIAKVLRSP